MSNLTSPRILIVRLSAIGDTILTLPVLCALRTRFPSAFLAWLVEPAAAPMIQGHYAVDEVIVAQRRWLKSPTEMSRIRRRLRDLKFDITIDAQSLSKSSLAAWLSGASQRIGFGSPQGRELALWLNRQRIVPKAEHLVDRQLELLAPLGIVQPEVRFELPRSQQAQETIGKLIHEHHLGCGYAVINPGAGWESRIWPADRFGKAARHLWERWKLPALVTWAGNEELAMAEQIRAASGGHALVAPRTSLLELSELVRGAKLFLGSDTGPLHMAAAVGTTCIGLYGTTRYQHSGPYGGQHVAIQAFYQEGTSRQRRRADNTAMRSIALETVCAACDSVIAAKARTNGLRRAA